MDMYGKAVAPEQSVVQDKKVLQQTMKAWNYFNVRLYFV
jgi:hypothetical protein